MRGYVIVKIKIAVVLVNMVQSYFRFPGSRCVSTDLRIVALTSMDRAALIQCVKLDYTAIDVL